MALYNVFKVPVLNKNISSITKNDNNIILTHRTAVELEPTSAVSNVDNVLIVTKSNLLESMSKIKLTGIRYRITNHVTFNNGGNVIIQLDTPVPYYNLFLYSFFRLSNKEIEEYTVTNNTGFTYTQELSKSYFPIILFNDYDVKPANYYTPYDITLDNWNKKSYINIIQNFWALPFLDQTFSYGFLLEYLKKFDLNVLSISRLTYYIATEFTFKIIKPDKCFFD